MYENMDLDRIITPVNVVKLEELLKESHYDKQEITLLVDGFTNGFSIRYEGSEDVKITSPNLKF